MRIRKTKVYPFAELSETAKEKAVENMADINIDYEWWEFTFEDAGQVKLNLAEFDCGRGGYCRGEFIEDAMDAANAILKQHGACCPTHETATEYISESATLNEKYPEVLDDEDYDENEFERENQQDMLDQEFLHDILEDYRIILQKEYEHLASEAAIIETIEANEYEFTENGKLA